MSTEIVENIHRIVIPFEDIYTTVFVIQTDAGTLLFDTATFGSDIDKYVFPELDKFGMTPKYVFITHNHRDHAGGLARVIEKYPNISVVSRSEALSTKWENIIVPVNGDLLLGSLRVVEIPGHTKDCIGLLDTRTATLLTGDSLQVYGIYGSGNWGANIRFPTRHLAALDKLRLMNIETVIASHDYHPLGYIAQGRPEVERYLNGCAAALEGIREMICDFPDLDDAALAKQYNETKGLPTIGAHVMEAVRRELA